MHQHRSIRTSRDDHSVDGTKPQKRDWMVWMAAECANLGSGAPIVNGDVAQPITQHKLLVVVTDAQGGDVVDRDILIHALQVASDSTPHLDVPTVGGCKAHVAWIETDADDHRSRDWHRGNSGRLVAGLGCCPGGGHPGGGSVQKRKCLEVHPRVHAKVHARSMRGHVGLNHWEWH